MTRRVREKAKDRAERIAGLSAARSLGERDAASKTGLLERRIFASSTPSTNTQQQSIDQQAERDRQVFPVDTQRDGAARGGEPGETPTHQVNRWMSSSLSQRELLLLPQTAQTGMLLTMLQGNAASAIGGGEINLMGGIVPQQGIPPSSLQSQPPAHVLSQPTVPVPSPTRVTSTHMPSALCEKLIQLCNQYHVIISDNGNSMDCRMKRRNLWVEISKQLNSEFNVDFTADQYKKKYQNLKTALKTKMQNLSGQPGSSSSGRQMSPDSRRDSQSSSTSQTQPVTPIEIKQEMPITSPSSPAPQQQQTITSLAGLINFPSSSPVRPTPQVPTTPLATLFDKNNFLALAIHAAQIANQQNVSGISPHISAEHLSLPAGMNVHNLLDIVTHQPQLDRPPSVEVTSGVSFGPLSVLRPISTGLIEREINQETAVMSAEHPGSAVGSASVSDHAAPLSSLPHISPQQDEDPARMFCLSLADPLRRIRDLNPMLYVQLKKQISTIVLDAEMDMVKGADSPGTRTPTDSDIRME
ncbi:unnamed protein product, partial [Mesorhabditis belari]|uniref:Regulatory protein zeste n=1 Tax=Mesorhabditis belari TaxID=2138241 RepID=A0AAF3J7D7_9BILA